METAFSNVNQLLFIEQMKIADITHWIKIITDSLRNEISRRSLSSEHWNILSKLSARACECCECFNSSAITAEELEFISDLFRCLRNACAGGFTNRQFIISDTDILVNSAKIFTHFAEHHSENSSDQETSVLNCCLQFFGNIIYQNDKMKHFVWTVLYKPDLILKLLGSRNAKVQEYCMMVLYNCVTSENADDVLSTPEGQAFLLQLVDSLCGNLIDWGVFLLESFMKNEKFMCNCYDVLPFKNRLLILDLFAEALDDSTDNSQASVPLHIINHIINLFITDAMDIVKLCSTAMMPDLKPVEISKVLSVLCAASIHDHYSRTVKSSPKLLEVSLDVLKCVHLLGKSENNAFTSLSSIKQMTEVDQKKVEQSPSYEFKKNLIRLIGNVCSDCKDNQDLVRSMDGIPLLLDCCCLDVRNPYIMQWSILAIRNLMEKNEENQEFVSKISVSEGLIDSPLLKELGLEVYMCDGKPTLRKYVTDDLNL